MCPRNHFETNKACLNDNPLPSLQVKVGDFVLCHNSSENFYMGQVLDIPNQSEVLCVEYRDNKNDSDQNPSNKKITSISRDCIFRWGNFEDVRASCMGEDF